MQNTKLNYWKMFTVPVRAVGATLLFVTIALYNVHAQAFFEGKDGPLDPVVALLNLYTNYPAFSAKATVTIQYEGATNKLPMVVHYTVANGKIASSFDNTQLSPDCAALFKQLGIAEIRSIFSIHDNEAIVEYPGKKGYYKLTLPADAPHFVPLKIVKEVLARDKIGGHDCQHCRFDVTVADGTKQSVDAWEATDLNGFPVQLTYSTEYFYVVRTQKATVSIKFDEVNFTKPERTAFLPPDNFKQYLSREELMAAPVSNN
jgi:hypothetical protein